MIKRQLVSTTNNGNLTRFQKSFALKCEDLGNTGRSAEIAEIYVGLK